jgi:hypothetical protein
LDRTPLAYTNAPKTLENETRAALRRSQQTSGLSNSVRSGLSNSVRSGLSKSVRSGLSNSVRSGLSSGEELDTLRSLQGPGESPGWGGGLYLRHSLLVLLGEGKAGAMRRKRRRYEKEKTALGEGKDGTMRRKRRLLRTRRVLRWLVSNEGYG